MKTLTRKRSGFLCFLISFALLAVAAVCDAHDPAIEPDPLGPDPVSEIRVFCHSPGPGGPAAHQWLIRLDVYNRRNVPVWYLIRWRSGRPLPSSPNLTFGEPISPMEISCRVYNGSQNRGWGRLVLLEIPCTGGPFLAFRMPARGYLQMADFELYSPGPPEAFEAWEASSLSVNGTYSLEDWLPFDSSSGFRIRLPSGTPGSDFASARRWKLERISGGPELRPARQLNAAILRKWLLPLRPPPRAG